LKKEENGKISELEGKEVKETGCGSHAIGLRGCVKTTIREG